MPAGSFEFGTSWAATGQTAREHRRQMANTVLASLFIWVQPPGGASLCTYEKRRGHDLEQVCFSLSGHVSPINLCAPWQRRFPEWLRRLSLGLSGKARYPSTKPAINSWLTRNSFSIKVLAGSINSHSHLGCRSVASLPPAWPRSP